MVKVDPGRLPEQKPPGQEDPDPSPQRVQRPGPQAGAGRVLNKVLFWARNPPARLRHWPPLPPPPPLALAPSLPLAAPAPWQPLPLAESGHRWKGFFESKGSSLGLNPKRNRFGWFPASDGVGCEKRTRSPSTIGPELLFAPDEAFEPLLHPNLHSIYALLQQTPNPKPQTLNPKP